MTLHIELTPVQEARLTTAARMHGTDPQTLAQQFVIERLPESGEDNNAAPIARTAANDPALALLEAWIAAAPSDPQEIKAAEAELEDFRRNLNANRAATGERLLFP